MIRWNYIYIFRVLLNIRTIKLSRINLLFRSITNVGSTKDKQLLSGFNFYPKTYVYFLTLIHTFAET